MGDECSHEVSLVTAENTSEVIVGSCSFKKWVQKGKLSTRKVIVVFS